MTMGKPRLVEEQSYIADIETGTIMRFQMMPEVTDTKSVNWNFIEIIGRSHPILGYSSSAPRTLAFNLMFVAHPSHEDGTTAIQVRDNLRFLQSLAYPDYSGGVKPPHRVLINLGAQTKMVGVIQDVSIIYKDFWINNLPVVAEAAVTAIEANQKPISYSVIRGSMGADS